MAVEPGRLNESHDGCGTLPRAQRSCKQPVGASQRDRANPILDPVVVDGQRAVVKEPRQCMPTPEAIVHRLGDRGSVGRLLSVQQQPFAQFVGDRPRLQQRFVVAARLTSSAYVTSESEPNSFSASGPALMIAHDQEVGAPREAGPPRVTPWRKRSVPRVVVANSLNAQPREISHMHPAGCPRM